MKTSARAALMAFGFALGLAATPAAAALKVGDKAPVFATTVAMAGKDAQFSLAQALKKGPVVLYFFPAAFTSGCDIEANAFADAADEFKAAGATVIGMTAGNVDRIKEFSTAKCRNKFAVGAARPELIKSYDVVLARKPELTDRISYVIAPDGRILNVHHDMNPNGHITSSLDAVKKWKAAQRGKRRT
jgi:peroxiredoxin